MYDIVIKNCRLFDGETLHDGVCDVATADGIIEKIGSVTDAAETVDARGAVLSPGFIDSHLHIYPMATSIGVRAEGICFPYGVTAAVDAGSAGCNTFEALLPADGYSRVDVKYLLNVSSAGFSTLHCEPEDIDPKYYDEKKISHLIKKYPNKIVGLKIRTGRETTKDMGLSPLRAAAELAHALGTRLVVHSTNSPAPMSEVCDCLFRGDVLTHMYHGGENTIIEDGKTARGAKDARSRGVLFDVGDARVHLSFATAKKAIEAGFLPDTISGDLTLRGAFIRGAHCLPYVMSKQIALGIDTVDVLRHVTSAPADIYGFDGGRIHEGGRADLALIDIEKGRFEFKDANGEILAGDKMIIPLATVKDGAFVYRDVRI